VTVTLTTAGCPIRGHFQTSVRDAVMALEGVRAVNVSFDVMDDTQKAALRQTLGRSRAAEGALARVRTSSASARARAASASRR
jgi:ATP-binding protein involved in chromosome partitioning